jgi:hypothetical protein
MAGMAQRSLASTLLVLFGIACGFVVAEGVARLMLEPPPGYALYSKERNEAHASLAKLVADPRLGHHLEPDAPGHDARGFRNEASVDSTDVVVIGDSQTWGVNVRREEAWPAVLAKVSHLSVYSMALGGWGPPQYEVLAHDATALGPKAILVGLYFGNDIFDSCSAIYSSKGSHKYRRSDRDLSSALTELQSRLKSTENEARVALVLEQVDRLGAVAKVWQRVAGRSLILQILMTRGWLPGIPSVDELYEAGDKAWALEHPNAAAAYTNGTVSTIMTYGYRGVALDRENPCIQEGVRITREVLASLRKLGETTRIRMGVVLIPTKESIYAAVDEGFLSHASKEFAKLVRHEAEIKAELQSWCNVLALVCIDATDRLVAAARNGAILYKADSDGHPIAEGYRQIAYAGQDALLAVGLLNAR